jgi:hypothetical protein
LYLLLPFEQANEIAEQTAELSAMEVEGKEFIPVIGPKLPDGFFLGFLKQQGLRLEGAEDIKSLRESRGEGGPSKTRLEEVLKGLENGDIRFVLRSSEE